MSAWTTYRSLSAEQKAILKEKKLDLKRPAGELLALLKPLASCDAVANKAQRKTGCTLALMILATLVGMVMFSKAGWKPVTLVVIVLLAVATFAAGFFYSWLRRIDVSNNLRAFTVPVLTLFREDFDPRVPVHLRLDLSSPTTKTKKTDVSKPYQHGRYHKVIDTMYRDPWMSAAAVLVDGTKLSWTVTDRIRERTMTKKNARGKYKTKTKYKKVSDLEVQVGLRTKSFTVAGAELSADGKRSKVEVERRVRTDSLDPIDPRTLIDAITSVYRTARTKKEATA
ncbi:MAG: hypothetical protein ABI779_06120 [Acidobacteriota bacterium]